MSEKITAKYFFTEFTKIKDDPEAKESYPSNKSFTSFVIPKINEILDNSIEQQLKNVQNEYYRIDAIKWAKCKNDNDRSCHLRNHLWDLQVAVEHENDSRDWMDEVTKLAHICCDLRVVIGYLPHEKRKIDEKDKNEDEDIKCLDYIVNALQKLACYDNMKRGEFLIIIGSSDTGGEKHQDKFFHYKGYIFNKTTENFEELSIS